MEERGYRLSAEVCSMPAEAADKLIESGDGDCALLYIYFARRGSAPAPELCRALGMTAKRLKAAADKLRALGLVTGGAEEKAEGLPEYTAEEIVSRTRSDGGFRDVLAECESVLGHALSGADTRTLFGIYDYLGLPADVIMVLLHHCARGMPPPLRARARAEYAPDRARGLRLGEPRDNDARAGGRVHPRPRGAARRHRAAAPGLRNTRPAALADGAEVYRELARARLPARGARARLRPDGHEHGLAQVELHGQDSPQLAREGPAHARRR